MVVFYVKISYIPASCIRFYDGKYFVDLLYITVSNQMIWCKERLIERSSKYTFKDYDEGEWTNQSVKRIVESRSWILNKFTQNMF